MKTRFLFLLILLAQVAIGQTLNSGQLFKFKTRVEAKFITTMDSQSGLKSIPANSMVWLEESIIYKVQSVDHVTKKVRFYALDFEPLGTNNKRRNTENDLYYKYNYKLFEIDMSVYTSDAVDYTIPDRLNFGVLSLPFKLRPQSKFSFNTEFNLNLALGIKVTPSHYAWKIYIQGGAGTGSVKITTAGTETDVMALTGFSGLMVQYKDLQVGIYAGADWVNNNETLQWQSQGKLWFSLGIGYKIFTIVNKETN